MAAQEPKTKFLLAVVNPTIRQALQRKIEERVTEALFFLASDGSEAFQKITNDPDQIVILDADLPKATGREVIERVIASDKYQKTAMILLSEIPDEEAFVDEVVVGRVQFVASALDETAFARALSKVLSYRSNGDKAEFSLRHLSAGDLLIKQGDKADFVYILKSGQMQAEVVQDGMKRILGQVELGEFVGEMAYINGEPRMANVVANSECELIEIPIDQLDHILFQRPSWSKALLKTLSKRVKKAATR